MESANQVSERERAALQLSLFNPPPAPVGDEADLFTEDASLFTETADLFTSGRPWSAREFDAWRPPDSSMVSEWAIRHRILSAKYSSSPGPWKHRGYYAVEIMDAFLDPLLEDLVLMAAAQSSKTDGVYNMLGYAIDQDPAPALIVMPSIKTTARVNERIKDMIMECPALSAHLTGREDDLKLNEIKLDNMIIYFATAGSSADLRNVLARYVIQDEVDDYPVSSGKGLQGSPMAQADARAITFWNRKRIKLCTPTLESGNINREYQKSDMRRYYMPCPHCNGYQVLSFFRLKHSGCNLGEWPKDRRDRDYIVTNSVTRYECEHCGAEIEEKDKSWMDRMGTWVPEGHPIAADGTVEIPMPRSRRRGYQWSALISPWVTWDELAAEFFEVKDDPEKLKVFYNLKLGETWKETVATASESEIYQARCTLGPQVVPQDAVALTCGIDRQKYAFWFLVRAWARDYTSWLIHYGQVPAWDDLETLLFDTSYPVEGDSEKTARIWRAGIDTGGGKYEELQAAASSTEETYFWLRKNSIGRGCRVWGTKGASSRLAGKVHVGKPLDRTPSGKPIPGGLQLVMLDTEKLKDSYHYRLSQASRSNAPESDAAFPQAAFLHSEVDAVYISHILAEEKRKDRHGIEEYVRIRKDNHLLDCEVIAHALADPEWPGGGVNLIRGSQAGEGRPSVPRGENPYLRGRGNPFLRR